MFGQIDTIRMARDLGAHATARQQTVARNVANADTPGYRAADLRDFADIWRDQPRDGLRATRAGHVAATGWGAAAGRPVDAQHTCVAKAAAPVPSGIGTPTSEGRHTVSPAPSEMKDLPPFCRETMFSTVATKP